MVKNTGGNKSKKMARKTTSGAGGGGNQAVRRVADPCEMYAAVTKIYSSKRCDITGTDGITRPCNIRGKFIGRKRSGDGSLAPGVWVMVGFYDWEVRGDGIKSCDLLEIYTQNEKEKLKQLEGNKLNAIMGIGELAGAENEFTFSAFHEKGDEDDVEEDKEEEEDDIAKPQPIVEKKKVTPIQAVVCVIETPKEQMDWLNIKEDDI